MKTLLFMTVLGLLGSVLMMALSADKAKDTLPLLKAISAGQLPAGELPPGPLGDALRMQAMTDCLARCNQGTVEGEEGAYEAVSECRAACAAAAPALPSSHAVPAEPVRRARTVKID